MSESNDDGRLRPKSLKFWHIVAMAVGGMIGTWIVDMRLWFEMSGTGAAGALLLSLLLTIPVALVYSELHSMLPFSSAESVWATNAFNELAGFIVGWALTMLYVLALTWSVFGIGTIASYPYPEIEFFWVRLAGTILLLIWMGITMLKVEVSGKTALTMVAIMIGIAIISWIFFFGSGEWSTANIDLLPHGWSPFFALTGILLFKWIGFDLIPQYAEETDYPRAKEWKLYIVALAITGAVYTMAVLAVGGIWGPEQIAEARVIDPLIAEYLGMQWLAWVIVGGAILTVITVLPGFWGAGSRILYGLGKQRIIVPIFNKVNKHGQPWLANLFMGISAIFFAIIAPIEWVGYIYTVFSFTAGLAFFVVVLSWFALRYRKPDWERPFKLSGKIGWVLAIIGLGFVTYVMYASIMEATTEGFIALGVWYGLGALFWIYRTLKKRQDPEKYQVKKLTPEDMSEEVRNM